jgi:hypothetical protein
LPAKAKTIVNATKWMQDSCAESGILSEDWAQLLADGGSNAIGSIHEYEVVSRSEVKVHRLVLSLTSATLTRIGTQEVMHQAQWSLLISPMRSWEQS